MKIQATFVIATMAGIAALVSACTGPSVDALRERDDAVGFFGRESAEDVASCLSEQLESVKAFGSVIVVERHYDDRITIYETLPNTAMSVFDIHGGQWRTRVDVAVRRHLYRGNMKPLYQEITRDCLSPA